MKLVPLNCVPELDALYEQFSAEFLQRTLHSTNLLKAFGPIDSVGYFKRLLEVESEFVGSVSYYLVRSADGIFMAVIEHLSLDEGCNLADSLMFIIDEVRCDFGCSTILPRWVLGVMDLFEPAGIKPDTMFFMV